MRIFKNKAFNKWARDEGLSADDLRDAVAEMEAGKTGSSLGGKIYKKRIALNGRGKRGGARVIIGFKLAGNIFFIYGFAKNKRATVSPLELTALQKLAGEYLAYTDKELDMAVGKKVLIEIKVKDDG